VDTIRICEVLRAMEAYSCYAQFLVSNSVSIQTFVTTSAHPVAHLTLIVLLHDTGQDNLLNSFLI